MNVVFESLYNVFLICRLICQLMYVLNSLMTPASLWWQNQTESISLTV